ncbi:dethiobiotin synthase [Deltaproteobacteria bacterium TL4]
MTKLIYVGGSSKGVGKTFVALGLITCFLTDSKVGAFKPVDVGHIHYNAADAFTDGERLHQAALMTEHINLVNPFLFNEDLPPVLAGQRDGVKISSKTIKQYLELLKQHFELVVIEGSRGLYLPVSSEETELDLLIQWRPKIIWVAGIGEHELSDTLLQVKQLQQQNLEVVGVILNNREDSFHSDLIRYQWLTLEQQLAIRVIGLIPCLKTGHDDVKTLGKVLAQNLEAGLLERLQS